MASEIIADLVNRITEELRSNDYKLIPSPVTLLNKLADAQEYLCIHCKALRKYWNVALKKDVFEYPFDDSIVNVHRITYNDKPFLKYEVIPKQIYSFSDDIVISGDAGNQMSLLTITGASLNNTSNGILWWRVKNGIIEIRKSNDELETSLVISGDMNFIDAFPEEVILTEVNSSGLSGKVTMAGKANDTDQQNNKFTFEITTSKRTLKLKSDVEISEGDKITMVTFVKPKLSERINEDNSPIIDSSLNKYLVKLALADYRNAVPTLEGKETIKEEAMAEALILNMDDVASVKKNSRNTLYF